MPLRPLPLLLLFALVGGAWAPAPMVAAQPQAPAGHAKAGLAQAASPAGLLQADGTLRLDGQFNGSLNLQGWDVRLDPTRGPVFGPTGGGGDPLPGGQWASLGQGNAPLNGPVTALAVNGNVVYLAGYFTDANSGGHLYDHVVRWDATAGTWSALAPDVAMIGPVSALAVSGTIVYAGGNFGSLQGPNGAVPGTFYLAEFNGTSWTTVGGDGTGGSSLNGSVSALAISGTVLYVGGAFTSVNDRGTTLGAAAYAASWDGSHWAALGYGANINKGALNGEVDALAVSGHTVYAGGQFTNVNNKNNALPVADYLAQWDTSTGNWAAVGHGATGNDPSLNGAVLALATDGSGNLFAGGVFTDVATSLFGLGPMPSADYIARWDGSFWAAMGTGTAPDYGALNGPVNTIVVSGTTVYAGGTFTDVKNGSTILDAADYVAAAQWNGINYTWSAVGSGGAGGGALQPGSVVQALARDAAGRLYVGGDFTRVSDSGSMLGNAAYLADWDGAHWAALPGQPNGALNVATTGRVYAVAVSGSNVYVGGDFTAVHSGPNLMTGASYLAEWDGTHWLALGSDYAGDSALNGPVYALAVTGTTLYVGGDFVDVADQGVAIHGADYVATWDGTHWHPLSGDGVSNGSLKGMVRALALSGSDLYVGGDFTNVNDGGNPLPAADYIAKWSPTTGHWSALGSNGASNGSLTARVQALAVSGSRVYAGGAFANVNDGGNPMKAADYVAYFDTTGGHWYALGFNGVGDGSLIGVVYALAVSGNGVYVGGDFQNVNNQGTALPGGRYLARWDTGTQQWSTLSNDGAGGSALNQPVHALAADGGNVYAGGDFTDINDGGKVLGAADNVAKWDGTHWSALGSDGLGNGALSHYAMYNQEVAALAIQNQNLYVGGRFYDVSNNGASLPAADGVAAFGLNYSIYLPLVRR